MGRHQPIFNRTKCWGFQSKYSKTKHLNFGWQGYSTTQPQLAIYSKLLWKCILCIVLIHLAFHNSMHVKCDLVHLHTYCNKYLKSQYKRFNSIIFKIVLSLSPSPILLEITNYIKVSRFYPSTLKIMRTLWILFYLYH